MKKTLLIAALVLGMSSCGAQRNLRTPLDTSHPDQLEPTEQKGMISGGYSDFRPATTEDQELLDKATSEIEDIAYMARSVSKQVVAGMNYRFRALACPKATCVPRYEVEITIFEALPCNGGALTVKSITRMNNNPTSPQATE